ncbi:H(+)/Cl(-) exchange transporter ClcA [Orbaceae bacterium ac157xtp]
MDSKHYAKLKKRILLFNKLRHLQDRAPLIVLFVAAIIGIITGVVGVGFQYGVNWVAEQRLAISFEFGSYAVFFSIILSMLLAIFAYALVKRYAPESGGSGIPEIEGALVNLRPVRWKQVLPVKFIGGLGALGSGMVLGREGPTVQIGGNIGKMVADLFKVRGDTYKHTFIATGAAAGVTAAFNAPLAGILFIIEEMRPQFRYNITSIKAIFVGVIMASIVYQFLIRPGSVFQIGYFHAVPVNSLWLYLLLGIIFGVGGVISNWCVLNCQALFQRFYQKGRYHFVITGAVLGGLFGGLTIIFPEITGGGFSFIPDAIAGHYLFNSLCFIFLLRFLATILCFSSGAPGGIFAPTLALGTILGTLFGMIIQSAFPEYNIELGACAIIGMGGLFAATIRAPLTGIILVMEMTDNYQLILPMIITCLGATLIAQALGGKPLYSAILERILIRAIKPDLTKTTK